jgi:hypothetical protein
LTGSGSSFAPGERDGRPGTDGHGSTSIRGPASGGTADTGKIFIAKTGGILYNQKLFAANGRPAGFRRQHMELDVKVGTESLSITIDNPFRMDIESLVRKIESFLAAQGAEQKGLDIRGLLPKMVKGIAGCEGGCPADARNFVSRGFANFELAYIEGGILHAWAALEDGKRLSLKMFPDF